MSVSTLTGTVTAAIILGMGQYGSGLVIAVGAAVEPSLEGAVAVTGPSYVGHASIGNYGMVIGANAGQSESGGDGVLLQAVSAVVNAGSISGGAGGIIAGGGGVGVDLSVGGTLRNSGSISGGGAGGQYAPDGSAGVVLGASASVTNSGTLEGGSGFGSRRDPTGVGGAGVAFQGGGTLTNTGTIVAGYNARAAAIFYGTARVMNAGTINGYSAAAGLALLDGGSVANTGVIEGATGGLYASNGRAGLLADGAARIFNGGVITGGAGADLAAGAGGSNPGGDGGIGIVLSAPGSVCDNAGTLTGGAGGYADFDSPGNGGVAACLSLGNLLVNSGKIIGGAGGANGGLMPGGLSAPGGNGGAGVVLIGGEMFNLGSITGGAGGTSMTDPGGAGAAGVIVSSGTLVAAAGTISGGAAAAGYAGPSSGLAVTFGNRLPATLIVDPGAVFAGGVEASSSVADTLVLGGTASGSLSAFGESGGFTNFRAIAEKAGAHWSLTGSFTSSESFAMGGNAFLALGGAVDGSQIGFAQSGGDTLCLDDAAAFSGTLSTPGAADAIQLTGIYATSFAYGNGLLALLGGSGGTLATLAFAGSHMASEFQLEAIAGGTQINFTPA